MTYLQMLPVDVLNMIAGYKSSVSVEYYRERSVFIAKGEIDIYIAINRDLVRYPSSTKLGILRTIKTGLIENDITLELMNCNTTYASVVFRKDMTAVVTLDKLRIVLRDKLYRDFVQWYCGLYGI